MERAGLSVRTGFHVGQVLGQGPRRVRRVPVHLTTSPGAHLQPSASLPAPGCSLPAGPSAQVPPAQRGLYQFAKTNTPPSQPCPTSTPSVSYTAPHVHWSLGPTEGQLSGQGRV